MKASPFIVFQFKQLCHLVKEQEQYHETWLTHPALQRLNIQNEQAVITPQAVIHKLDWIPGKNEYIYRNQPKSLVPLQDDTGQDGKVSKLVGQFLGKE